MEKIWQAWNEKRTAPSFQSEALFLLIAVELLHDGRFGFRKQEKLPSFAEGIISARSYALSSTSFVNKVLDSSKVEAYFANPTSKKSWDISYLVIFVNNEISDLLSNGL